MFLSALGQVMSQPRLFDDPTATEIKPAKRRREGAYATPFAIGSGPPGETCKTCVHRKMLDYHNKTYNKCGLMQKSWTHGGATDIKLRWAACWSWMPLNMSTRILKLGDYSVQLLERMGNELTPMHLQLIAEHYEELGMDMGWLRHAANKLQWKLK
jgi:hypothetical protein